VVPVLWAEFYLQFQGNPGFFFEIKGKQTRLTSRALTSPDGKNPHYPQLNESRG